MRNLWLSAALGAACGAVVSWVVASDVRPVPDAGAEDLRAAVSDLRSAVSALQRTLDRSGAGVRTTLSPGLVPADEPSAATPVQTAASAREPAAPGTPAAPLREAGREELREPEREALKGLRQWEDEERAARGGEPAPSGPSVRRRWLFATEAEVLHAFGTPDTVHGGADDEVWHYRLGDDEGGVYLHFWNGRLRRIGL